MNINLDEIYTSLTSRMVPDKEFNEIEESINKHYKIKNKSFTYYNPILREFTTHLKYEKSLNHNDRLAKLVKKIDRVDVVGYFYKAKIKTKNRHFYHTNIFLKEIPLLPYNLSHLHYNKGHMNPYYENIYYNSLYHPNSPNNMEIMVTYLVSKLNELNISPHFGKMFGCYRTIMDKFTFDITKESSFRDEEYVKEYIEENGDNIKFYTKRKGVFLEFENYPCYLLATEKAEMDIDVLYEHDKLDYHSLLSFSFQIYAAITTMMLIFGIKHNDLHLSNVLLSITKEQYIYYKYKNQYFRVPTYGYIIKVIDWGRATYEFNGHGGWNEIFASDNDCFCQYYYPKINNRGKDSSMPSDYKWSDMIMVTHNMLNAWEDYRDTDLGKAMKKWISSKSGELDLNAFDWSIYCDIYNFEFNLEPQHIFQHKVYKNFYILKDTIPKDAKIYPLSIDKK